MATIKEMASQTYPDHPTNKELTRCRRLRRDGYEVGANAVLEEVERTISVSEDGSLESNLRKLIKELKEE